MFVHANAIALSLSPHWCLARLAALSCAEDLLLEILLGPPFEDEQSSIGIARIITVPFHFEGLSEYNSRLQCNLLASDYKMYRIMW